jgi:hypothetical protein
MAELSNGVNLTAQWSVPLAAGQAGSRGTIEIRFCFREAPACFSRPDGMDGELYPPSSRTRCKIFILQGFEWGFLEVERKEYESQNTH